MKKVKPSENFMCCNIEQKDKSLLTANFIKSLLAAKVIKSLLVANVIKKLTCCKCSAACPGMT
jgi:hypothetical protein